MTDDLEALRFNTAISRLMEFVNAFTAHGGPAPKSAMETFTLLLAPLAPHVAEELWQILGHEQTLAYEPWPTYDPALLKDDEVEIPVQVNGKLRGRVVVPADADGAAHRGRRPRRRADRRPARGQDDPQGRRRPGQAGQLRGGMTRSEDAFAGPCIGDVSAFVSPASSPQAGGPEGPAA